MLILTRHEGEKIIIQTEQGDVAVSIQQVAGRKQVRVGIDAPRSVPVMRAELLDDSAT